MKKIIFSIFVIFILFTCINYINADVVVTENKISYITAGTEADAKKKQSVYGTIITDKDNDEKEIKGWTNSDGIEKCTSNWYLKYIYKEEINGYEAFCLDPGKRVDTSYVVAKENDADFAKLYNRKVELAAIYDLELTGELLNISYAPSSGNVMEYISLTEEDEYLIKQLLFWYVANGTNLVSTSEMYKRTWLVFLWVCV